MAQVWSAPVAIDVGAVIPATGEATNRVITVPSPSCPDSFAPQQRSPAGTIAHECAGSYATPVSLNPPDASAVAPLTIIVITGEDRSILVPSPSCPASPAPQHATAPVVPVTQVCSDPEAIVVDSRPTLTSVGRS